MKGIVNLAIYKKGKNMEESESHPIGCRPEKDISISIQKVKRLLDQYLKKERMETNRQKEVKLNEYILFLNFIL